MFKKKSLLVFFLVLFSLQALASFTIEKNDTNTNVELIYDPSNYEFKIVHSSGIESLVPYVIDNGVKLNLKEFEQSKDLFFIEQIDKPTDDEGKEIENNIKWGFTFTSFGTLSEIGFDFTGSQNITKIDSNETDARIIVGGVTQDFGDIIKEGYTVAIKSTGKNTASIQITNLPLSGTITLDPIIIKTGGAVSNLSEPSHYGLVKDGNFFAVAWTDDAGGGGTDLLFSRSINGGTTWSTDINLSVGLTTDSVSRIFNIAIDTNAKKLHLIFTALNTQSIPNTTNYYYRVCSYNIDVNCSTLAKWSAGFDLNFVVPSNNDPVSQSLSPFGMDINSTGTIFVALFSQIGVGNREIVLLHADGNTQVKGNWKSDSNAVFSNAEFELTTGLDLVVTGDVNVNIVGGIRSPSPFVRFSMWNAATRTFLVQDQNTTDSCRITGTGCSYPQIRKKSNGDLVVYDANNGNGEILRYYRDQNTWLPAIGVGGSGNGETITVFNNDVYISQNSTNVGYKVLYDSNQSMSGFNQLEAEASNCCRKWGNTDANSSIEMTYITAATDVKFTRLSAANLGNINFFVTAIEGILDLTGTFPTFSQVKDGNLTIRFFVQSDVNNNLLIDLNFSSNKTQGQGIVIINDLNLNSNGIYCASQNFLLGTTCTWDFNIAPQFVLSDGNYYVNGSLQRDGNIYYNSSDKNFLIDNTAPQLLDLNIFISGSPFRTSDFNAGFQIRCNDNNSTIINNVIGRNDTNILDVNAARNTIRTTDSNVTNGDITFKGYCFDAGRNSAFGSQIVNVRAFTFIIIDEETGLDYNVLTADAVRAIRYDGNFIYNFQTAVPGGTNKLFYVTTTQDYIRFDFNYSTAFIPRDINIFTLPTDSNIVKICGVKRGAVFAQQLFVSTSPKQAIMISDLYDCYVVSDFTKFANNDLLSISAYTILGPYQVFTFNAGAQVQLSLIDGASAHTINLDALLFNSVARVFSIAGQELSIDTNSIANTVNIVYENLNEDSNRVTINLYDGTTANILFTTTNTTTPNGFSAVFSAGSLSDLNKDVYKVEAVVTKQSGEIITLTKYFSTSGFEGNVLNPMLAVVLALSFFVVGITLVSPRFAFGWFGILMAGIALVITALAPGTWYLVLTQAFLIISGVFIGFTYWKENTEVV